MTAKNAAALPVVKWARNLGCEVTRTRSQHWRVTYRGRVVGFIASTPSCPRSLKNSRAGILRRVRALKAASAVN